MLTLALLTLMLSPVQAEPVDIELPVCGKQIPITRALLAAIPNDGLVGAHGPNGDGFLIGDLSTSSRGTVAFVRSHGRWRAYSAGSLLVTIAVYRSGRTGNSFAWTQIQRAGYGTEFSQIRLFASGQRPKCDKSLRFPAQYRDQGMAGEFSFLDFNLAGNGRGSFLATGHSEDGTYRYRTHDYALNWSAPVKTRSLEPGPGAFRRVSDAPADLIQSLRRKAP